MSLLDEFRSLYSSYCLISRTVDWRQVRMRPFHNVDEQEIVKHDINLHVCRPAILVRTLTRPIWNLSCSQRWTQSDSKLQFPVSYRDAPRMRNSVLSSVSALYRDRNSAFGAFPCKTWDFQNPDSGFEFRIAMLPRYGIHSVFRVGRVRNWMFRKRARSCPSEGCLGGCFVGFCGHLVFGPSALHSLPQNIVAKFCLFWWFSLWRSCVAEHTHHGSRFWGLSPQVEACNRCMHCSGKPSNRTKLPDTMGNRRHFPTPGLPNPVATSLGDPWASPRRTSQVQKLWPASRIWPKPAWSRHDPRGAWAVRAYRPRGACHLPETHTPQDATPFPTRPCPILIS